MSMPVIQEQDFIMPKAAFLCREWEKRQQP